jgi:hypothetical protein
VLREIESAVQEMHSKAEFSDLGRCLLAIHACLMSQESVPRAWLLLDPTPDKEPLKNLLLADIKSLDEETRLLIRQVHLSPARLNAITGRNRELALQLCEDHLESLHGKGFLCYEQTRLTPFAEDRIFAYAERHPQVASSSLHAILALRHRRLSECWRRFGDEAMPRGDGRQSTLWRRALVNKIETQWRAIWMPPDLYDCDSRERSIINSLRLDEVE